MRNLLKKIIPFEGEGRLLILSIALLICSGLLMAEITQEVTHPSHGEEFYEYSKVFSEVFYEIQSKYVDEIDEKELFEGAIRGMFFTLDAHSQFMGSDAFDQLEKDTEGRFSGIGIHITLRDGILTVIAPIPGTPAARAGVQSWDRIIEINEVSTKGITLLEAVKKLTGAPGTTVDIKVFRKEEVDYISFTLTRAQIKIESVYSKVLEGDIGYLRLTKFSDNTMAGVRKALTNFKKEQVKAVILDLRSNSGGLLNSAIEVSDAFLEQGKIIVSTRGRMQGQNKVFKSLNRPLINVPMAILVNHGSASASEIVAGALQDHSRAVLIGPTGQKTFGKGSVQTIEQLVSTFDYDDDNNPLPNGIRLTMAKYYTPSGRSIHEIGLEPDVEIDLSEGEELELQKYGTLLGDPVMIEPIETGEPSATQTPTESPEDEETPTIEPDDRISTPSLDRDESESEEDSPIKDFIDKVTGKNGPEEEEKKVVDTQLVESLKIMKAYLIMAHANNGDDEQE